MKNKQNQNKTKRNAKPNWMLLAHTKHATTDRNTDGTNIWVEWLLASKHTTYIKYSKFIEIHVIGLWQGSVRSVNKIVSFEFNYLRLNFLRNHLCMCRVAMTNNLSEKFFFLFVRIKSSRCWLCNLIQCMKMHNMYAIERKFR